MIRPLSPYDPPMRLRHLRKVKLSSPRTWSGVQQLAAALTAVAVVAIIVDVASDALDAWAPNVTVGALSIAATITVVNRIVQREERLRVQPLLDWAHRDIQEQLETFAYALMSHYVETHQTSYVRPASSALADIAASWLEQMENVDAPSSDKTEVIAAAKVTADQFDRIRRDNRDVLEPALMIALDQFARGVRQQEFLAPLMNQLLGARPLHEDAYLIASSSVVQAVASLAAELEQMTGLGPALRDEFIEGIELTRQQLGQHHRAPPPSP
jgi:hypothetical protein